MTLQDPQLEVIRCLALAIIADLKRQWPHLRSGDHDEDMVSEALCHAVDKVLPRYLPRSYRRPLADFAYKAIHGHLLQYALETSSDWHCGRESRRDLLETYRSPVDAYEAVIVDERGDDLEVEQLRARVRERLCEIVDECPDVGIVLATEAMGDSCGEVGAQLGQHHNSIAYRRDVALEHLRGDEELRDLHAERFGGDSLDIDYGHELVARAAEAFVAWAVSVARPRVQLVLIPRPRPRRARLLPADRRVPTARRPPWVTWAAPFSARAGPAARAAA